MRQPENPIQTYAKAHGIFQQKRTAKRMMRGGMRTVSKSASRSHRSPAHRHTGSPVLHEHAALAQLSNPFDRVPNHTLQHIIRVLAETRRGATDGAGGIGHLPRNAEVKAGADLGMGLVNE